MPSKYVAIQGVATYLRHSGPTTLPECPPDLSKGEVVLCIHHCGGNSRNFDGFAAELADRHSPLAFDLPGHDRSGSQVGLGSIAAMADFAASVLKALEVDRPAVIVGHGMGGNVALQMALEHRESVRAVVIANSGARYTCGDELIERARLVSVGRARREFELKAFAKGCDQGIVRAGFMDTLKTDPRVIYSNLMAMRDWDGAGRLGEIEVPTLVCTGEADLSETNAEAERTADKISQARQQVIAGAAHMLPTEQPGALADAVSGFLEALE
ncbi:MAG: alpha/beta hydrolase [Deltaproteobacteria bacterium]|nr:alpha/beta hydrolase [Deltaproteobacteria bacterium]